VGHATDPHAGHGHPPHLAHHFDTPEQQFQSGKLGMWIFLATEILLFGGLFCAYAVYRANHPEIFLYAHRYLDATLGGINTVVLLCSSLTMAWAVRCAQLGKRKGLIVLLSLTLLGGFGFLGIKYVEYEHKWKHGLLWGKSYAPDHGDDAGAHPEAAEPESGDTAAAPAEPVAAPAPSNGPEAEPTLVPRAAEGPRGTVDPDAGEPAHRAPPESPRNVQIFFSIYFAMTGLHGLHVIAGMCAIGWTLFRAIGGAFSAQYYTPVDLVGLYWHLVDLIWIYLFPLLYLIH
jgi:cytochrome c oxidase subunit III